MVKGDGKAHISDGECVPSKFLGVMSWLHRMGGEGEQPEVKRWVCKSSEPIELLQAFQLD